MLNLGIIGINEGNGHPYSYSAVFNGYNESCLDSDCPFEIIRKYLRTHHRNQEFIKNARVTHVWTHDKAESERIARVSNIPNICKSIEDLTGKADAVIFARDDMWNHWKMAGPIFESGKPVYMDKLLAHSREDLDKFIAAAGPEYPLMTASSFKFAPELEKAKAEIDISQLKTVHGMSPCEWVRYAPHLLDPLFEILGRDVVSVQNSGRHKADIVTVTYRNGAQAVLQVMEGVALPLGLTCHFAGKNPPRPILYTDPSLESYFLSIVNMMRAFADMAEKNLRPVSFRDTVFLNKIVLAAIASREKGGVKINITE